MIKGSSGDSPIRVLIVDDNAPLRASLRSIFDWEDDINVVGEAVDGREAVERVGALRPDVVILDIEMPIMNGIEAARLIRQSLPDIKIVFFVAEVIWRTQAQAVGADAFLLKDTPIETVVDTIRQVTGQVARRAEEVPAPPSETPAESVATAQRQDDLDGLMRRIQDAIEQLSSLAASPTPPAEGSSPSPLAAAPPPGEQWRGPRSEIAEVLLNLNQTRARLDLELVTALLQGHREQLSAITQPPPASQPPAEAPPAEGLEAEPDAPAPATPGRPPMPLPATEPMLVPRAPEPAPHPPVSPPRTAAPAPETPPPVPPPWTAAPAPETPPPAPPPWTAAPAPETPPPVSPPRTAAPAPELPLRTPSPAPAPRRLGDLKPLQLPRADPRRDEVAAAVPAPPPIERVEDLELPAAVSSEPPQDWDYAAAQRRPTAWAGPSVTEAMPVGEAENGRASRTYQVSAYPFAAFSVLTRFLEAMSALPDVRDVRARRFHRGRLDATVEYAGESPLEERLQELSEFRPTILSQGEGVIQIVVGI